MKTVLLIASVAISTNVVAGEIEPIGYPGSQWGAIIFPASIGEELKDGKVIKNNVLLQGKLEQGVDWFRFGDNKYKFNTYGALNYTLDNAGFSYNNKIVPSIGMKITRTLEHGTLDLGIQAVYEHRLRPSTGERTSSTGVQAYIGWWTGWNLKD